MKLFFNLRCLQMVRSHSHEVLSKLNSQREAGMFCDITLKTGNGHSFVAHKAVLAAVSEYFQELFTEMDTLHSPYVDSCPKSTSLPRGKGSAPLIIGYTGQNLIFPQLSLR
uniref:BTB domain-containing protein n=1 Tax=Astyanax mexicanus TaxID=7994 RepID=A0A3B1K4A5_ASTMX